MTYGRSVSTRVPKLLGALFGSARSHAAVTRTRSESGHEAKALDDPWYDAD